MTTETQLPSARHPALGSILTIVLRGGHSAHFTDEQTEAQGGGIAWPTTQHGPTYTSACLHFSRGSGASSITTEVLRPSCRQPAEGSRVRKSEFKFLLNLLAVQLWASGSASLSLFPDLCKGGRLSSLQSCVRIPQVWRHTTCKKSGAKGYPFSLRYLGPYCHLCL